MTVSLFDGPALLAATVDVLATVAPYAIAIATILGVVGFVVWIFNRWNNEPPR